MADIRVTHSGRVFYRVDDCTAALLVEALPSIFERVKPQPQEAPPTVPRFFVEESIYTGAAMVSVIIPGGEKRSYSGSGDQKVAEATLGWAIPAETFAQFDAKRKVRR